MQYVRAIDIETPPALLGRRGPLKWLLRRFLDAVKFVEAEGVVEFEPLRIAVDQGAFARTEVGAQRWSGRSGRSLETLPRDTADQLPLLWLWVALDQVSSATDDGEEEVRGVACRRLVADLDFDSDRGTAADIFTGWRLATDTSFDTGAPRLQVWLDQQCLRRIRIAIPMGAQGTTADHTVELWDFGVDTSRLDWNRLSTFRTEHDREPNRV